MRRKLLVIAVAIPVGLALLLGAEVLLALRGPDLPERDPFELSGTVGSGDGPALRIAWIGDSVAAGVGASGPEATVPHLVAEGLGRPVHLDVFAVSGERAAGALEEQVPKVLALDPPPDVVVVEIGANDVIHLTRSLEFRLTYELILERVSSTGATVFALGMPAFGTATRFLQPLRAIVGWRSSRLDQQVRAAAREHGAEYVDIAGSTSAAFGDDPQRYYASDDFHPSDAGYRGWADAVLAAWE